MTFWDISGSYIWTKDRSDYINPLLNMENACLSVDLSSIWTQQYMIMPQQNSSLGMMDLFAKMFQNAYSAASSSIQANAFLFAGLGGVSGIPATDPQVPGTVVPQTGVVATPTADPVPPEEMSETEKDAFKNAMDAYKEVLGKFEGLSDEDAKNLKIYNKLQNIKKKYSAAKKTETITTCKTDLENILNSLNTDTLKKLLTQEDDILKSTKGYDRLVTPSVYSDSTDIATVKHMVVDATADTSENKGPNALEARNILNYDAWRLKQGKNLLIEVLLDKKTPGKADLTDEDIPLINDSVKHVAGLLTAAAIEFEANDNNITDKINKVNKALENYIEAANVYKGSNDNNVKKKAMENASKTLKEAYKDLYAEIRIARAVKADKANRELIEERESQLPDAIKEKYYDENGQWKTEFNFNEDNVRKELEKQKSLLEPKA